MEDYLKAAYRLTMDGRPATTQLLAEELGVSGPSVTNMIKRLHDMHLVRHTRYQGVELTPAGEKIALEVVRHHRLLELYLAETLGYSWDEVHEEAEKLEHHVSDELEARMDSYLGFPTRDPHGDPIPTREGVVPPDLDLPLADLGIGIAATVVRVSDRDPEQLRYLAELGLIPGTQVTIVERLPFDDLARIEVGGQIHIIGRQLSRAVWVERPE
ncbi:MAG: metal-dependent transcriptional regulator [Thermomicrobiales bacterium]|nr:metal-dependent transcriptional regulator [Thermomicrobiales bacterium]